MKGEGPEEVINNSLKTNLGPTDSIGLEKFYKISRIPENKNNLH